MILFPFLKIGNFICRQVGILIVAHHGPPGSGKTMLAKRLPTRLI
jgi:ATP-dependent 26S proteasome regulatory subunit